MRLITMRGSNRGKSGWNNRREEVKEGPGRCGPGPSSKRLTEIAGFPSGVFRFHETGSSSSLSHQVFFNTAEVIRMIAADRPTYQDSFSTR